MDVDLGTQVHANDMYPADIKTPMLATDFAGCPTAPDTLHLAGRGGRINLPERDGRFGSLLNRRGP
jgi:hypothetical protein